MIVIWPIIEQTLFKYYKLKWQIILIGKYNLFLKLEISLHFIWIND